MILPESILFMSIELMNDKYMEVLKCEMAMTIVRLILEWYKIVSWFDIYMHDVDSVFVCLQCNEN